VGRSSLPVKTHSCSRVRIQPNLLRWHGSTVGEWDAVARVARNGIYWFFCVQSAGDKKDRGRGREYVVGSCVQLVHGRTLKMTGKTPVFSVRSKGIRGASVDDTVIVAGRSIARAPTIPRKFATELLLLFPGRAFKKVDG